MKKVQMSLAVALMLMAAVLLREIFAPESQMFFGDRKQIFLLGGAMLVVATPMLFALWNNKAIGLRAFPGIPIVTAAWMAILHFMGKFMGADAFWGSLLFGGKKSIEGAIGLGSLIAITTIGAIYFNFLILSREEDRLRKKQSAPLRNEPEPLKVTEKPKEPTEPSESPKLEEVKASPVADKEATPTIKEEKAPKSMESKAETAKPIEKIPVKLVTTEAENPFVWVTR